MKILVFNGSPKREKSDTLHITRAFLDGMNDVHQNDVEFINVIDKRIGYCKGCFVCKQNGGICDIDDDMPQILNDILESDMLIFSFPLYCYGFPAPLKALLDRTMPLSTLAMLKDGDHYCHPTTHDFSKTRFVMICGCGFPDAKHNFEAITLQFHRMFPNLTCQPHTAERLRVPVFSGYFGHLPTRRKWCKNLNFTSVLSYHLSEKFCTYNVTLRKTIKLFHS